MVVYQKEHPCTIQAMFDRIAPRYDLANAIHSLALHHRWKRTFVRHLLSHQPCLTFLDLCAGTGDIAFDYLKNSSLSCHIHLIDFSLEMLEEAKRKAVKLSLPSHCLSYLQADVHELPLKDGLANCVAMAYGIRNVQDPSRCLHEIFRVLQPGGRLGILELTRPHHPLFNWGHGLYLRHVLPLMSKWVTHEPQAYHYLCESIQTFMAPQEFETLLQREGFVHTHRHPLAGGIATIFIAHKPH